MKYIVLFLLSIFLATNALARDNSPAILLGNPFNKQPLVVFMKDNEFIDVAPASDNFPICTGNNGFFHSLRNKDCFINENKAIELTKGKPEKSLIIVNMFEQRKNKCWLDSKRVNCFYGKAKFWIRKEIDKN